MNVLVISGGRHPYEESTPVSVGIVLPQGLGDLNREDETWRQ